MPATVSSVSIGTSVTTARYRLSVATVRPSATVAPQFVPVAALEHIELVLSAYMDTTGRYRFIDDVVLMLDSTSIAFSKSLSDSQSIDDQAYKQPGKSLASSVGSVDSESYELLKALFDQATALDATALQIAKILADAYEVSDQPALTASKVLASDFGLTDAQTVQAQKVIDDSITFVEVVIAVRTFVRQFDEAIDPLEVFAQVFVKAPFTEDLLAEDASNILSFKNLADGVAIDDGAAVGDGSTYFFEKSLNNVAFADDAEAFTLSKPLTEQLDLTESGLVVMQGYCDLTYFAEDYVGVSSSF